jgi:uncharacterized protein (DUF2141 family)
MQKICLFAIMFIGMFFGSTTFAQDGIIAVEIMGVVGEDGQIFIGLFHNNDGFPDKGKEYKGVFVKAKNGTLNYTFTEIPTGDYAIAIFHDSNENGKLDKNLLGIPKEGYGFSEDATAIMSTPAFEEAKFTHNGTYTSQIKMKY